MQVQLVFFVLHERIIEQGINEKDLIYVLGKTGNH